MLNVCEVFNKSGNLAVLNCCGGWLGLFKRLDDIRGSPGTSRAKRMRGGEGAPPRIKTKAATAKQLPSVTYLTKCISTMAAVSKLLFSTQINVKVRN